MRRFSTTLLGILLSFPLLLTAIYAQTAEKPDLSKHPTLYVVGYAHVHTELHRQRRHLLHKHNQGIS